MYVGGGGADGNKTVGETERADISGLGGTNCAKLHTLTPTIEPSSPPLSGGGCWLPHSNAKGRCIRYGGAGDTVAYMTAPKDAGRPCVTMPTPVLVESTSTSHGLRMAGRDTSATRAWEWAPQGQLAAVLSSGARIPPSPTKLHAPLPPWFNGVKLCVQYIVLQPTHHIHHFTVPQSRYSSNAASKNKGHALHNH